MRHRTSRRGSAPSYLAEALESRLLLAVALADITNATLGATPKTFTGSLSASNLIDIYKFSATSAGPFNFNAKLTGVTSGDFDLQLVQDKNHNGTLDNGEVIDSSVTRGIHDEHIAHPLTVPDSYFLLVTRITGAHTYSLTMSNASTDQAGNTLANATLLIANGISSGAAAFDLVGPIDDADIYKFFVSDGNELRVDLISPTNGAIAVDVIVNFNGDTEISQDEILGTLSGTTVLDGVVVPGSRNVFFRVRPTVTSNVNYHIVITTSPTTPFSGFAAAIDLTLPTKIEAENFDNGGEGLAYHDTTTGNDNGATRADDNVDIKSSADTDGGTDPNDHRFRVTDTEVGEFLNYTIEVLQAGNYDIDFRASSPAAGAACHLEIDGTDVTGSVAIPNTGGFDVMTTVTRPAVPLTAGPHVATLSFDSGTSTGFAGSYNFIRFTPAASPGTFKLTPAQSTVAPGQSDKIAITWTVPSGSWHLLHDIQLRLLSADGTRIKVRWNELENTLRLYDNVTHKYGPAKKIGSNTTLSNQFVQVHMATSSVKASGSTSPTVTLTIDLRFANASSGKAFILAVAANDDPGHHQPFQDAGYVVVS